jgi:hypothetical protein
MYVTISLFAGVGIQFFDDSGVPLAGGKIYSYEAGTTTPATTYIDNTAVNANTNPIILNSAGRIVNEIWLDFADQYKFVIKDANDVTLATYDNVYGALSSTPTLLSLTVNGPITATGNLTIGGDADIAGEITTQDFTSDNDIYINTVRAGRSDSTGGANTVFGAGALAAVTSAFGTVAIGTNALSKMTENAYSTAVGAYALENAYLPGNVNLLGTAVGAYALNASTNGQYNVAVGAYSSMFNTEGYFNTSVGTSSLRYNLLGWGNAAVGYASLTDATGTLNTAIGAFAGFVTTSGAGNTFAGGYCMERNTTGNSNAVFGAYGMRQNTTGSSNVAVGIEAGAGVFDGNANTTGSNNIFIGTNCVGGSPTANNQIVIGYQAFGEGNNSTIIGNTSTTLTGFFGNVMSRTPATTSMTNGFIYIAASGGAPSGTPLVYADRVPMYYDSSANKFYVYNGGWKGVNLS